MGYITVSRSKINWEGGIGLSVREGFKCSSALLSHFLSYKHFLTFHVSQLLPQCFVFLLFKWGKIWCYKQGTDIWWICGRSAGADLGFIKGGANSNLLGGSVLYTPPVCEACWN